MSARPAPCGGWRSSLRARRIARGALRLGDVRAAGDDVFWVEGRPSEGGRSVLVRAGPVGDPEDLLGAPWSARTRVHEYGGGAYAVHSGTAWFSNLSDQRVWQVALRGGDREPRPVTPDDGRRYADAEVDAARGRLIAVCEDPRDPGETLNGLVSIPLAGGEPLALAGGHDFFASPRLSPDGSALAWLAWDHPDMPWDAAVLYRARVAPDGTLGPAEALAGGAGVAVFEPSWAADGALWFVSDEDGWWNLRRFTDGRTERPLVREAEFGLPQWVFGMSTYAHLEDGRVAAAFCEAGSWGLGLLDPGADDADRFERVDLPYTVVTDVVAVRGGLAFSAGSPVQPLSLVRLDLAEGRPRVLRAAGEQLDPAMVSVPEAITFPTAHGEVAHGFFYPPRNPDFRVPDDERPPLLVKIHGGPTAASGALLDPRIQFWTTRGFAVLDVNYRGSSGFGRAYRERLRGAWGVADREDCEHGARHLAAEGRVDGARLAISGGSAGGYTALCALVFGDTFAAGASYYGVADLEALARDTHKFESRYLDGLVGPYPQQRERYRERSPIHGAEALARPVIFFQGLDDPIVPPAQSEAMVDVLRRKGLPVAYLPFEGESHGFRRAETLVRALEAELAFYGAVFGFEPADEIPPIPLENAALA